MLVGELKSILSGITENIDVKVKSPEYDGDNTYDIGSYIIEYDKQNNAIELVLKTEY
jgi:hypothetical protein